MSFNWIINLYIRHTRPLFNIVVILTTILSYCAFDVAPVGSRRCSAFEGAKYKLALNFVWYFHFFSSFSIKLERVMIVSSRPKVWRENSVFDD